MMDLIDNKQNTTPHQYFHRQERQIYPIRRNYIYGHIITIRFPNGESDYPPRRPPLYVRTRENKGDHQQLLDYRRRPDLP